MGSNIVFDRAALLPSVRKFFLRRNFSGEILSNAAGKKKGEGTTMINIPTGYTTNCEGVTRREFIRIGALSFMGLSLPAFLRARAASAQTSQRDVNCILLWMNGGPSHIDTFDPKPHAPQEIRGPFGAIKTNVPGIEICEHLPKLAQQQDKFSIIRSLTSPDSGHETATSYLLSGYKFNRSLTYPAYGSVVAREKGFQNGMPPYVLFGGLPFGYGGGGYMGDIYNPFQVSGDPNAASFSVRDVTPPAGVNLARIANRRDMLEIVDTFQRDTETAAKQVQTMDKFYERAYDLVTSPIAKKAFNLSLEPDKLRDEYGRHSFGQSCLMARRLIEAGVRFVTINMGGWDTHTDNFNALKNSRLPQVDSAYSALLKDLHQRGMLDSTLVIWMGEFGRTPKINNSAGRDHWGLSTVVCLGGGGIKTGMVYGRSDERAEGPADKACRVEDLAATIYRALGIDYRKEYREPQGRPVKINYDGEVLEELLG